MSFEFYRVLIVGSPGSGKSTLARAVAAKTGHPLLHLDYMYWQPGWVAMPREEFIALQQQWMKQPHWMIDGNYNGTMELRFAKADLVIFLDLPRLLCLRRVVLRHGTRRPDLRPDVKEGSIFSRDFVQFCGFIWRYPKKGRAKVLALHRKYPQAEFLRLRTQREADEFLQGI